MPFLIYKQMPRLGRFALPLTVLLSLAILATLVTGFGSNAQARETRIVSKSGAVLDVEYLAAPTAHTPIQWESDEIAAMPEAILVEAGKTVRLRIVPGTTYVTPGGHWKSESGTITPDGVYTAPEFLPEAGLDRVTYVQANGGDTELLLCIVPNPSLPGSELTPVVRVSTAIQEDFTQTTVGAVVAGATTVAEGQTNFGLAMLPSVNDVTALLEQGVVPLGPTESLPPLQEYTDARPLSPDAHQTLTICRAPIYGYPLADSPIGILCDSNESTPQMVRLVPAAPESVIQNRQATDQQRNEFACATDTQTEVPPPNAPGACGCNPEGKVQYKELPVERAQLIGGPTILQLGTVKLTHSHKTTIEAAIPNVGSLSGEVGPVVDVTYNVLAKDWSWKQMQKRHMYKCVAKKMKYVRTETRIRTGTTRDYIPWWMWPLWGGPRPNEFRWGPWSSWGA